MACLHWTINGRDIIATAEVSAAVTLTRYKEFLGEFDEATDDHQVLATHDRHNQRVQWYGHVVDRGQSVTIPAQNDFQQTRRNRRKRRSYVGQQHHGRRADQQQQDDHDVDGAELNVSCWLLRVQTWPVRDAANGKSQQRRYTGTRSR
uniref:Uncharacterized protein n=1 Tax=Sipha flava TaxID=143950 RepID=A0A2S2PXZ1_9HEMI